MSRLAGRLVLSLAFSCAAAACTGAIGDGAGKSGGGSNTPGNNTPGNNNTGTGNGNTGNGNTGNGNTGNNPNQPGDAPAPPSAQIACPTDGSQTVGKRALRRMTTPELEATIRNAFGLDAAKWRGLTVPPDPASQDGFTNNVDRLVVGSEYVTGALESGRKVAGVVSADPTLGQLLPCAAMGGKPCAETFVSTFGTKLYRRPLTQTETGRYLALFDKVGVQDFKAFVYWATAAMLQSPNVIYRSELGEPDGKGRFKLTPYEIASELAFTLTGAPPTPDLLALAAANKLGTPDEIETAARALVFDGANVKPGFRAVIERFTDQWLNLGTLQNLKKDDMAFPDFAQVQDALGEETRRLISAVLLEEKGGVDALLTAKFTFVDAKLAKYYGFGGAPAGTDFVKVDRPAGWGLGILAQGSMLAVESHSLSTSPTKRGVMVRERLMCNPIPPPPPVVDPIPEPTEAQTTRQRYESVHVADAACKACHQLFDPIGFTFEHLDASGRFRAKEGKFDIDDSGVVSATSAGDIKVKGAAELSQAIAKLPEVANCAASHIAAYALGASKDNAACLVGGATDELRKGGSLVDFFVRLTRSEHFRSRQQ